MFSRESVLCVKSLKKYLKQLTWKMFMDKSDIYSRAYVHMTCMISLVAN